MKKAIVISGALAMPFVVSAQQIVVILSRFRQILDLLIPIFITLAVLFFFWGLIMYIKAGGGTEQKDTGKFYMIWAVIALFVMVSIFGIIGLIGNTFDIRQGQTIILPQVPVR
ncbi:MAG: hypothetical protein AAB858_00520 [Patescibacteria group bacterium]